MEEKSMQQLARLVGIIDRLRVECPWDRKQTFSSLRNNTIEETFELADAITDGDRSQIREELGDLLMHVVFYARMGTEEGVFDLEDVARTVSEKLIYRHPHVFGETVAETPEQVKHNWEQLKLREKGHGEGGVMGGVPRSLPALVKAYRIGEKAAAVGFDWQQREQVWSKVDEELAEVRTEVAAGDGDALEGELGDLLFAVVNAARLYGIDPEQALERTNRKFIRRFRSMERQATEEGTPLGDRTASDMERLWQRAKAEER